MMIDELITLCSVISLYTPRDSQLQYKETQIKAVRTCYLIIQVKSVKAAQYKNGNVMY